MAKKRPWYKRFGSNFIAGTMALTLEEKGAYSLCLDLIYDRGEAIPDDERWLAKVCGVSVRKWRTLRASLIKHGKIIAKDGYLSNERAERHLAELSDNQEVADTSAKGGRKRVENVSKTSRKPAEKQATSANINDLAQPKLEARSQIDTAAADARAREPGIKTGIKVSEQAWTLASQIAEIAGHPPNPPDWPPGWAGAPMRIQGWLNEDWEPPIILIGVRASAAKKRPGSITRVEYFEGAISDERARQSRPLPKTEVSHAQVVRPAVHATSRPGGGFASLARDRAKAAGGT